MNPYEELNVKKNANQATITKAFRKRSLVTHPDRGGTPEAFALTKLAHEVLSDPARRQKFDDTGEIDPTTVDNSHVEALTLLHGAFEVVMVGMLQANRKPAEHDVLDKMRRVLREGLAGPEKNLKEIGDAIAFASDCVERFEGGQIMEPLLRSELMRLEKCQRDVQQAIDRSKLALKLLEGLSFKHTPKKHEGFGATLSMGGIPLGKVQIPPDGFTTNW